MWLLNTKTLKLEEFLLENMVRYAILSHRWESEEISFADMQHVEKARKKRGFAKIRRFCEVATKQGFQYGWVDCCCIDKSSSAELSEAINSMYRWYQSAAVCYAYLVDVSVKRMGDFRYSDWFKRGWTLQELLAPAKVIFYDRDWQEMGDKHSLCAQIKIATNIHEDAIRWGIIHSFSVAERFSWAADRVTTRPEDVAYSLLGIFDVNMPMLYGEGKKAFFRLQEQIIKDSDDRTIFMWSGFDDKHSGLLASSPVYFRNMQGLSSIPHPDRKPFEPHVLTSRGVSIEVDLWPVSWSTYIATILLIDGREVSSGGDRCIFLRKVHEPEQYVRVAHDGDYLTVLSEKSSLQRFRMAMNRKQVARPHVRKTVTVFQRWPRPEKIVVLTDNAFPVMRNCFHVPTVPSRNPIGNLHLAKVDCLGTWDETKKVLAVSDGQFGTAGVFTNTQAEGVASAPADNHPGRMLLGFDINFEPVCVIASAKGSQLPASGYRYISGDPTRMPEDLSTTAFEDITCYETKGWSIIHSGRASEVEGRPGLWAIKLKYRKDRGTYLGNTDWKISVSENRIEGIWMWTVTLGIE